MLTFKNFTGINNVVPEHRLKNTELLQALNCDVGMSSELSRRDGYALALNTCHKNVWEGNTFNLATQSGNDLVSFTTPTGTRTTVSASLGTARVWYVNLPDGRTAFSNGLINGITNGGAATGWGVPVPVSTGSVTPIGGQLNAGIYFCLLTYVRLSDNLEGGAKFSASFTLNANSGISISGLPVLAGYKINVYLSTSNDDDGYLAGSTTGSTFTFAGANNTLTTPCRNMFLYPAPVGRCLASWRGRALVTVGNVLYASLPGRWEHFDLRRDFKQFRFPITAVVPVQDGIVIGTEENLIFLEGKEFDKLVFNPLMDTGVVLGSGVQVSGALIKRGDSVGSGSAALLISDGYVVAAFDDGNIERLTESRYRTTATEVSATFRMVNGIPQYIAIPR